MAKKLKSSSARPGSAAASRASDASSTPSFFSGWGGGGSGQMMLLAPPVQKPPATVPQPPSRRAKFELRVARVLDRWAKAAKRWKVPKGQKRPTPPAGIVLAQKFRAVVDRCFEANDSEARCATELLAAQQASEKGKKKWWRPRAKTGVDDRCARNHANCKSMEMFR